VIQRSERKLPIKEQRWREERKQRILEVARTKKKGKVISIFSVLEPTTLMNDIFICLNIVSN
jgi:hypothetical protein